MRRFTALGLAVALVVPLAASVSAATVGGSWPVGRGPLSLALDSATGKVYVANSEIALPDGTGLISVVDPARNSVRSLATTLTSNFALADVSRRRLYSSNARLDASETSLDVFDLDGGARIATIPAAGGLAMALDADSGLLYVCGAGFVTVVDTATNAVVAVREAPAGASWFGVAVGGGRAYLTNINGSAPSVFALDLQDLSIVAEIPLSTVPRFAIAFDAAQGVVLVAGSDPNGDFSRSAFYVIDAATLSVVHTTSTPGFPMGIARDPANGRILLTDGARMLAATGRRIFVLDDATFDVTEVIGRFQFGPGMPLVHPDGRLYLGATPLSGSDYSLVAVELGNHAPEIRSVTFSPTSPRTNDVVTAIIDVYDPDLREMGAPDPTVLTYQWFRNGAVIPGATGPSHDLSATGAGDKWETISVQVTATDGQLSSTTLEHVGVADTPGTATVELSNPAPRTNEQLSVGVVLTDPDSETFSCTLAYFVNGNLLFNVSGCGYTYPLSVHGYGDRGDVLTFRATMTDQLERWQIVASATAVVADSEPVVTVELSDPTPASQDVLVATTTAFDPDADPVTLRYVWTVNGSSRRDTTSTALSDSFDLKLKGNGDNGDEVKVTVIGSDGELESWPVSATATVTPGRKR